MKPPIREKLVDPIDEATVQRITARIGETLKRPERAPRGWLFGVPPKAVALGLASALVILAVSILWDSDTPIASSVDSVHQDPSEESAGARQPETVAEETSLAFALDTPQAGRMLRGSWRGEDAGQRLRLADGSSLELSPGAQLDVLSNDGSELAFRTQGTIRFDVEPGGPRTWRIDAGLANVEVLGTRFVVERSEAQVRVRVERGHVRVRSPLLSEQTRDLHAGEEVSVVARPGPPEPDTETGLETETENVVPATSNEPIASNWRRLSRDGRHRDAYAQLGEDFGAEVARVQSITDLMALADVARLSGHPIDAIEPLERASARPSDDPRVVLAAFTKGRLEFEVLRDARAAVASFRRALDLGPSASLEEAIRARLVESLRASGQGEEARRVAAVFLQDYPSSVHLHRVQQE